MMPEDWGKLMKEGQLSSIDDELQKVLWESGRLLDDQSAEFLTALRRAGALNDDDWKRFTEYLRSALAFLSAPSTQDRWERDPRNQDWLRIATATRLAGHHLPMWAALWLWRLHTDTSPGLWRQVGRVARQFGYPHIYPSAYFDTRFRTDAPVSVWPRAFVIVSASATTGEVWTEGENRTADAALEAELHAEARWLTRVTGYSPATGHSEPSWAVDLRLHETLALGRRYKQDAIYVVRRDVLSVIRCEPGMPMAFVGRFSSRIDGPGDTPSKSAVSGS